MGLPGRPTRKFLDMEKPLWKWVLEDLSVASPGIEPGSGASETLILSIVLRGQYANATYRNSAGWYQIFLRQSPAILRRKIFLPQSILRGPMHAQSSAKILIPGK